MRDPLRRSIGRPAARRCAGAGRRSAARSAKRSGKKRLGYDGPTPTLAMLRQQGITTVSVTCHGLWQGFTCHRTTSLPLDRLGASDDMRFLDLCRTLRLVCSRCGGRKMHIVPLWPDVRQSRASSLGVDQRPTMPGTVVEFRMPGAEETVNPG